MFPDNREYVFGDYVLRKSEPAIQVIELDNYLTLAKGLMRQHKFDVNWEKFGIWAVVCWYKEGSGLAWHKDLDYDPGATQCNDGVISPAWAQPDSR